MVRLITMLLLLSACTSIPVKIEHIPVIKFKDSYLKYSGYVDGCADTASKLVQQSYPNDDVNDVWLDAMCMDLYLLKLEEENIEPEMARYHRYEGI